MTWAGSIFDAHFHIIDPRYPLTPNQGYLPEDFTVADYQQRTEGLNVKGGAVVSGSFQGFDQKYLKNALQQLGDNFIGVTQIPASLTDQEIQDLNQMGVRAVRFNLKRGGSAGVEQLEHLARRVFELATWHTELYVEAKHLEELKTVLLKLPSVSIDHLGLTREGQSTLLKLAEGGVRVKATGFSRCDFPVGPFLKDLANANPDCLMFGTDLPSTRAPRPFGQEDLELLKNIFDAEQLKKIFLDNAMLFYRMTA